MTTNRAAEEEHLDEQEKRWGRRGAKAALMALFIIVLDIAAIALGVTGTVSVALSVGAVGVITFIGVLILANYLSRDPELAKKEMRKAIAASFTLVYLVLLGLVVFTETPGADAELASTVVGHFTWVVGIIIIFYFGSRTIEEYLNRKK